MILLRLSQSSLPCRHFGPYHTNLCPTTTSNFHRDTFQSFDLFYTREWTQTITLIRASNLQRQIPIQIGATLNPQTAERAH
jgi:hypothetical protein